MITPHAICCVFLIWVISWAIFSAMLVWCSVFCCCQVKSYCLQNVSFSNRWQEKLWFIAWWKYVVFSIRLGLHKLSLKNNLNPHRLMCPFYLKGKHEKPCCCPLHSSKKKKFTYCWFSHIRIIFTYLVNHLISCQILFHMMHLLHRQITHVNHRSSLMGAQSVSSFICHVSS